MEVEFLVDDLTDLRHVNGQFDLLVDYGTLDDLGGQDRDAYIREVLPLAAPESQFLLWCFEWSLRRWERIVTSILPFGNLALAPGEAERRFGRFFEIERVAAESDLPTWPRGWAAYPMRRRIGSATDVDASGTSA